MRILFAGTPQVAVPPLAALLASEHEVVGVLTRTDAPSGRGRKLTPSPVRVAAEAAGLPVLTAKPSDPDFAELISELQPDIAAVVAYGHLLKPEALELIPRGWLNLHFSLLPQWRGAAPVQRALINGDVETGVTVFQIDEGMDTGPVYAELATPIAPTETAGELLERLAAIGADLFVATLDGIEAGSLAPVPQTGAGTRAAKITPEVARVDWTLPAAEIANLVRGCTPDPGAWTEVSGVAGQDGGVRLGLGPVTLLPDYFELAPGAIQVTKKAVLVGTGTGAVELGQVQPVGKQPMRAADWARGARLAEGARFL